MKRVLDDQYKGLSCPRMARRHCLLNQLVAAACLEHIRETIRDSYQFASVGCELCQQHFEVREQHIDEFVVAVGHTGEEEEIVTERTDEIEPRWNFMSLSACVIDSFSCSEIFPCESNSVMRVSVLLAKANWLHLSEP